MWDWNLWQCVSSQRDSVNQDGVKMDSCWLLLLAFFFSAVSNFRSYDDDIRTHRGVCASIMKL